MIRVIFRTNALISQDVLLLYHVVYGCVGNYSTLVDKVTLTHWYFYQSGQDALYIAPFVEGPMDRDGPSKSITFWCRRLLPLSTSLATRGRSVYSKSLGRHGIVAHMPILSLVVKRYHDHS